MSLVLSDVTFMSRILHYFGYYLRDHEQSIDLLKHSGRPILKDNTDIRNILNNRLITPAPVYDKGVVRARKIYGVRV